MTSTHHVHKKYTAILAIIFLLPALYIFGVWLKAWNAEPDASQAAKTSAFLNWFPNGLTTNAVTFVSIGCCIAALVLAATSFKQRVVSLRVLMMLTVIFASFILLLDIFQLM